MKAGSVAVRKDGTMLRSGSEAYPGGIIVRVDPFVLMSEGMDMTWSTLDIEDFEPYKDIVLSDEEMKPFLEKLGK